MKRILGYVAMALAGGLLALGFQELINTRHTASGPGIPDTVMAPTHRVGHVPGTITTVTMPDLVDAAERTVNAVVHVTTETMVNVRDPFADFFWGYRPPTQQPRQGAGSGVIITDDGYIVTNNHVVDGADRIRVHLNDRRGYDATVIGRDPSTDIALLKVDATGLDAISFGNSDEVRVGQWVLAVGNPMNLTSTVTAGIVSAKARNINLLQYDPNKDIFPIESFIQTDAAVNPGNSGGALVNAAGELVGINTAIASTTGAYAGYSFAVPVNIVSKVTGDLLEFGTVQRAYIGVSIRDMDQKLASEAGLDRPRGVYINGITEGGAAQAAGMKAGDIIVKVGNIDVNNVPQLQEQVGRFRPGDRVPVTVLRSGRENVMDLTLRGREGGTAVAANRRSETLSTLGAELAVASPEDLKALNLEHGVKVVAVNSGKFRTSGIREGFIITRIDQDRIRKPEDVQRVLNGRKGGVLVEGVYPNGVRAYYGLGL
ncbi:MAG: trypsin-like peptidase domain-containing protein [Flavobacteriales bacterium]|nr:trypsin-like peptidase domain-containing protein [Flavobacteriales bacterium]